MLKIKIRQGKGGLHRWHLYEGATWHGMSRGYRSYNDAVAAAKRHYGDDVTLELSSGDPDEDWPLHAGPRDWAD